MHSTKSSRPARALSTLVVMSPAEIDQLPWLPSTGCPGVRVKELWRLDGAVDALIAYQQGRLDSRAPAPVGASSHLGGFRSRGGRRPAPCRRSLRVHSRGVEHPVDDVGTDGCVLLQMHRPEQSPPC
jgi:hypothetical protein